MEYYDIGEAFKKIEEELMASMIRNLKHHRAEEIEEGFEWSQWQVEQLSALEEYRRRNKKQFSDQFQEINDSIDTLIQLARQQGGMDQEIKILNAIKRGYRPSNTKASSEIMGEFFKVNDRKLNALVEATQNDFKKAEVAMLRMANDKYRKIIYNAQVYANAGGTTYEQAVDMATKDFLRAGINCIEYKNGYRHTMSDYADMCIRTATKRAYLTGEGEKRMEWGESLVIVNKRNAACPKCMRFCGVVLIDDVWSGGKPDGRHQLMSHAIEKGLYHPRCKDIHTTYFPGISTMPDKLSNEEKEKIVDDYNQEQKQNYYERKAEQQERIAKYSLDAENKRIHSSRADDWKDKITENVNDEAERIKWKELNEKYKSEDEAFLMGSEEDYKKYMKLNEKFGEYIESAPVNKYGEEIVFDLDRMFNSNKKYFNLERSKKRAKDLKEKITKLSNEYDTYLTRVQVGGMTVRANGVTELDGKIILSDTRPQTFIHEFAHTLATRKRVKTGLASDMEVEFEKELTRLFSEYKDAVHGNPKKGIPADPRKLISEYSFDSKDEFFAEAFAQYKMREYGYDMSKVLDFGDDYTYSEKVVALADKYFKRTSYEGGIPKGWRTIDITMDNAVKNSNPKYGTSIEYSKNCPNCACAYEMRRRGYDVVANPYINGGSHYLNRNPWEAWEDADVQIITKKSDLFTYTQNQGNGARFAIAIEYSDNSGHVIVGEIVDDILKLYDPQTGKDIIDIDFEDIKDVKLWKTNELTLSDRGIAACEGR